MSWIVSLKTVKNSRTSSTCGTSCNRSSIFNCISEKKNLDVYLQALAYPNFLGTKGLVVVYLQASCYRSLLLS